MEPISEDRKRELDQCVKSMLDAIPKKKQMEFLGEANELWLLIAKLPRVPKNSADSQ